MHPHPKGGEPVTANIFDTKYADNDKWETNAEIFEDLRLRLSNMQKELTTLRIDIRLVTEAMFINQEDTAFIAREIQNSIQELHQADYAIEKSKNNLEHFEERFSEMFTDMGPA